MAKGTLSRGELVLGFFSGIVRESDPVFVHMIQLLIGDTVVSPQNLIGTLQLSIFFQGLIR